MAELNVFYTGPGLAGVSTSLAMLTQSGESFGGTPLFLPAGVERAARGFVWHGGGRPRHVRLVSDGRSPYYFESLRAGLEHSLPQVRASCRRAIDFLAVAHGVVFVADSQRLRAEANLERLERTVEAFRAEGRSVDELPFVFQLNKRELPDLLSLDELRGLLKAPRCAYVESVATEGRGVHEALATLVAMVEGGS